MSGFRKSKKRSHQSGDSDGEIIRLSLFTCLAPAGGYLVYFQHGYLPAIGKSAVYLDGKGYVEIQGESAVLLGAVLFGVGTYSFFKVIHRIFESRFTFKGGVACLFSAVFYPAYLVSTFSLPWPATLFFAFAAFVSIAATLFEGLNKVSKIHFESGR